MANHVTTYVPDNSIKKGLGAMFQEVYHELAYNKWLTWQLFKRSFVSMGKQSVLGLIWPLVTPLISILTFIVLNNAKIFSIGEIEVPYPVYALLGMSVWQLFANGLSQSTQALVMAGAMLTKINFSKKSLIIASSGRVLLSFAIQVALLTILILFYGVSIHWQAVFIFPVIIVPVLLMTLGIGSMLSIINSVVRDISYVIPLMMTFLMFLTPVLYAKAKEGVLVAITEYNPMYYYIEGARDLLFKGTIEDVTGLSITVALSVVIFCLCTIFFHLTETRIAERI